jgi:hypothetical protein
VLLKIFTPYNKRFKKVYTFNFFSVVPYLLFKSKELTKVLVFPKKLFGGLHRRVVPMAFLTVASKPQGQWMAPEVLVRLVEVKLHTLGQGRF